MEGTFSEREPAVRDLEAGPPLRPGRSHPRLRPCVVPHALLKQGGTPHIWVQTNHLDLMRAMPSTADTYALEASHKYAES